MQCYVQKGSIESGGRLMGSTITFGPITPLCMQKLILTGQKTKMTNNWLLINSNNKHIHLIFILDIISLDLSLKKDLTG